MKVEIVSIGTELLVSDILDTNAAYVSRSLRELNVELSSKVTVGDDPEMIADVFRVALSRADVIIASGGIGNGRDDFTKEALAKLTGLELNPETKEIEEATKLGDAQLSYSGLMLEQPDGVVFCLPGRRRQMSYLLETEVLPYLRQQLSTDMVTGWALLRSVGLMESTLKQELVEMFPQAGQQITYDSFAGQTNVRIWAKAETEDKLQIELNGLREKIIERLGDHVFGSETARLENVVLDSLLENGKTVTIAECYTHRVIYNAMSILQNAGDAIHFNDSQTWQGLADSLQLNDPDEANLTQWCRQAAEKTMAKSGTDLGLIVYSNMTPGGVQILVTLASANGVSVTQRSFGGHPDNIDQWALTLGLAHLRRWLLVHC